MTQLVRDPAYPPLKAFLIETTGLAYYADKDAELADRIGRRLSRTGLQGCAAYLGLLRDGPAGEAELDALVAELTVGETYFFRHRELFDALRDVVLPDLIERSRHTRRLRIWSAGCATGPEPYSVAILLRRELGRRVAGWEVSILGTDINREFLARAREGRFEAWAFRSTPDDLKQACFSPSGKSYVIAPEYREGVSFQYHNLVKHPFPSLLNNLSGFDLILCRNVTIYFSPDVARRMISQFHQCLAEGGWLLVGHTEPNVEFFRAFRTVSAPGATLYQKGAGGQADQPHVSAPVKGPPRLTPDVPVPWSPPSVPEPALLTRKIASPPQAAPRAEEGPAPLDLTAVRLLADRGAWGEAARCCERLLERDRLNPGVHFYRALVLEQTGACAEAEQCLRRAIYLDRGFVLAHYHLGLFLQRRGDLSGAARAFENALRVLSRMEDGRTFEDGDGISVADLKQLAQTHLEVLRGT
jgi:chemotaxis protein methyltransferase CheR